MCFSEPAWTSHSFCYLHLCFSYCDMSKRLLGKRQHILTVLLAYRDKWNNPTDGYECFNIMSVFYLCQYTVKKFFSSLLWHIQFLWPPGCCAQIRLSFFLTLWLTVIGSGTQAPGTKCFWCWRHHWVWRSSERRERLDFHPNQMGLGVCSPY